jgi:hypothetical protein
MAPRNDSDDRLITKKVNAAILGLASMNGVQRPVRVIFDRSGQSCLAGHVRSAPKADLEAAVVAATVLMGAAMVCAASSSRSRCRKQPTICGNSL